MKNFKGFTVIEGLLILVILGMLGGLGWFVYSSNSKTNKALDDADAANSSVVDYSKKSEQPKTDAKNPTTGWINYSSKDGQYSLKYPKSWVVTPGREHCWDTDEFLMLGSDSKSIGRHCSDGGTAVGQITLISNKGDTKTSAELRDGYIDIATIAATVSGVEGIKIVGVASGQTDGEGIPGFEDGTKLTKYIFYTNNRTYTATYIQGYSYPDVLSDFELMVTKTLKFSAQ